VGAGTWQLLDQKIVLTPLHESGWMKNEPMTFSVLKFKGNWILVRADWPDYYDQHGVTEVSCFQRQAPGQCYSSVSDEELLRMAPFKAMVDTNEPCAVYLTTDDGRRLCFGGPGASSEVAIFVQSLVSGQTYRFPDALVEFRKRQSEKP
jgi:hypothetical protein